MNKKTLFAAAIIIALSTTSCLTNNAQKGTAVGAAGGAVVGQAIGRSTGATMIGLAAGAALGYMYGNEMDKNDKARMNQAYETNPSGQPTTWNNPDNGNQYTVTPTPSYKDNRGRDCREAEILTTIEGNAEKTITTACRIDGHWVLQ